MTGPTRTNEHSPQRPSAPGQHAVCFVALHALPAIEPGPSRPIGGTETRAWTFARGLAESGKRIVKFIVRTDKRREPFPVDGVTILPRADRLYMLYESVGRCLERSPRFPGVRVRSWEWPLLWRVPVLAALRFSGIDRRSPWRIDPVYTRDTAEIFLTFGVQANSACVISSAHAAGCKVILMIGSDGDLDERYRPGSTYISPYGDLASVCFQILQQADIIVAQTPHQQRLLKERFGRDGALVANPIDLEAWDCRRTISLSAEVTGAWEHYVLWVGRAESLHKRPEMLIELAQLCPELPFLMILNPREPSVERRVRDACPDNVRIVQHVPFDQMPAVFQHARLFVSTSALEGFPNVFLQAAATGVPIASLEVGSEFLTAAQCGVCADGDLSRLAEFVRTAWSDEAMRTGMGREGRLHVEKHHSLTTQVARLDHIIESALRTPSDGDASPTTNS